MDWNSGDDLIWNVEVGACDDEDENNEVGSGDDEKVEACCDVIIGDDEVIKSPAYFEVIT